jgi:hypothetical protein
MTRVNKINKRIVKKVIVWERVIDCRRGIEKDSRKKVIRIREIISTQNLLIKIKRE